MSLVTVPEFQGWIGFPDATSFSNDQIELVIAAAEQAITDYWGRPLNDQLKPLGDLEAVGKLAVLMKAARLWKRKDSPTGIEGMGDFGVAYISTREDSDIIGMLQATRDYDVVGGIA